MIDYRTIFGGEHGDFSTFFHDTDFESFVLRYFLYPRANDNAGYDLGDEVAVFKLCIGFTDLGNGDYMLHLVDAEGADDYDDITANANRTGVEFVKLSTLLDSELTIYPKDQLNEWDEDEDDDDDCDCGDDCGYWNEDEDDDDDKPVEITIDDTTLFRITPRGIRYRRAALDDFELYDGDEEAAADDDYDEYYEYGDAPEDYDDEDCNVEVTENPDGSITVVLDCEIEVFEDCDGDCSDCDNFDSCGEDDDDDLEYCPDCPDCGYSWVNCVCDEIDDWDDEDEDDDDEDEHCLACHDCFDFKGCRAIDNVLRRNTLIKGAVEAIKAFANNLADEGIGDYDLMDYHWDNLIEGIGWPSDDGVE